MLALVKWFPNNEEQYRYMKTLQRYISRFVSVSTNGSSDGRKPDGCGFHHWNNYEAYMYVYETIVKVL